MSEILMRELLEDEFKLDPLYNVAIIRELEEYIWNDKILSMSNERTYDTVEASKFIGRADATIRYYLRHELSDIYIKPEKQGRYYKLSYYTIFKIHLVSILIETGGMSTTEILTELGHKTTTVPSSKNTPLYDDLRKLSQFVEASYKFNNQLLVKMQQQTVLLLSYEKKLSNLRIESVNIERKIADAKSEVTELKNDSMSNYLLERQDQILVASLKKKPKGFFSRFKNDSKEELLNIEVDKQLKEKQEAAIQGKADLLKEKIDDYYKELNNIKEEIAETEQEYELALREQERILEEGKYSVQNFLNNPIENNIID
ncbi:hypothetical protein [Niallia sp. MER TA 168]|uniref:hypothetical protein n=1 Tax=Niallia sp. MER TA 168 TaxID=2939568 RepID=UPI002040CDF5|nr:hypothetical protein [Niallia sp. MER TA 168]MCM3364319.1 hypothetical protein [Niallia sp. MER TA 168]